MTIIVLIILYIASVFFARHSIAKWYRERRIDVGWFDVFIVFIPTLNIVAGALLMSDEKRLPNKFFGIDKRE